MHYLFFDATGDPGFKLKKTVRGGGSTPYYVQGIVSFESKDAKELAESKIKELRSRFKLPSNFEFKYHRRLSNPSKQSFWAEVAKLDARFFVTVLDKINSTQVKNLSALNGNDLTSRLVAQLVGEAVQNCKEFVFTVDEHEQAKVVVQHIRSEVSAEIRRRCLNTKCNKISARDSKKEDCLQLADMIAGLVMDSYEVKDKNLYKLIEKKMSLKEL